MTGLLRALGAGVLLLALAACTQPDDDPEPIMPSESTSPTSPASSPTPERESAEAFVRRWNEARTRMQNDGDTGYFKSLSRGCEACLGLARRIEGIYSAGGYAKTEGWQIRTYAERGSSSRRVVTIAVLSQPTTYVERKGDPPLHLKGGRTRHQLVLLLRGDAWSVTELVELG